MIIVGEKLNSSIPKTLQALINRDSEWIVNLVKTQQASGADYLDLNTALTGKNEIDDMLWLMDLVQANSNCGIMIDSPNQDVIASCIQKVEKRKTIINSITLDDKFDALTDIAIQYGAGVVCLPLKGNAIPLTAYERYQNARMLIKKLRDKGIPDENIYVDVLAEAIATNDHAASTALKTIVLVKNGFPEIRTICGLSNVSFGLPDRMKLNSVFLSMAIQNGLDSAILDITSETVKSTLAAANALVGKDEYCINYIDHCRKHKE